MVVKLKERHDRHRTGWAQPEGELVLGRENVVILAHLDEGLVAGLAAQLNRILLERPQLVVAGRPDHLGVPLPQQPQDLLNIAEGVADVAGHDQPVVAGLRAQVVDDPPVRRVRRVQIADREH